ncbi:Carn-acyltransf domain-containing protein [Aphelenchoides fujianensis]|nr:Carn-acyltransf domain-containing protein [Aphelenchoides fujianensis]
MSAKVQVAPPTKRAPRAPFPLDARFPSRTERILTKCQISFFNTIYPVRPWAFVTIVVSAFAFFLVKPEGLPLHSADSSRLFELVLAFTSAVFFALLPVVILRLFLRYFLFSYKRFLFEDPKKPSALTKVWAVCNKLRRILAPPLLNTCNSLLPRLPVPALQDTIDRYLQSMRPILDDEEFKRLTELSARFLSNEGPRLQRWAFLYSLIKTNYVTGLWEKYAYLYSRDSLLINSSVAHVDTLKPPAGATQITRAAHLAYCAALQMMAIYTEKQRPPGAGIVYSGHYKKLYSNVRKPRAEIDEWDVQELSRHIVVRANGCFYRLEVFDRASNRLLSVEEISDTLTELLQRRDEPTETERLLASLTHDKRDKWAENRRRFFLENATNRRFLRTVESAIVVLMLESEECHDYKAGDNEGLSRFMKAMLVGKNSWACKPLNFYVLPNGRFGGLSEHSVADGAEFDHIFENFVAIEKHFLKYPKDGNDEQTIAHFQPKSGMQKAERMVIEENYEMRSEVQRCFEDYEPRANDLDVASLHFTEFGKGAIKKARVSPDAFIQMAIQLANFRDQRKNVQTYEATSARFFDYSRTETLRSASSESAAFVRSVIDGADREESARLLRAACAAHVHRNRLAMTGQGVDRHLFALFVLSKGLGVDSPLLNDYADRKWLLSTSQPPVMSNQMDEEEDEEQMWMGGAFGAVAHAGYGICYRFVGNHSIVAHISSYHSAENTDSRHFRQLLTEAMRELLGILS